MAKIVRFSRDASTDFCSDIITRLGANARFKVYTGTIRANPEAGISGQVLLANCALATPTVGTESGGTLTFGAISNDISADATGTAAWVAFETSGGVGVFDAECGVVGSGEAVEFVTTSFVAGAPVAITAGTLRLP
jgi:hypothetical protein